MKQQENNEIESLLRSWSGRQSAASTSRSATAQPSSAHMDVDELNAYAEGELPAATRARYVSHLVDCDDCRKIVGQLTVASGKVITEPSVSAELATPWWKQTLSALLTPAVLKFALPTLVLFVIGVAFFSSRTSMNRSANIETTSKEPAKAAATATDTNSNAAGVVAVNSTPANNQPAKVSGSPSGDKTTAKEQKTEDKPEASAAADDVKKAPETTKQTESAESGQKRPPAAAQTVTVAPAPQPAAAKPASSATPKDADTYSSAGQPLADRGTRKREADKQRNEREADKRSNEGEANSAANASDSTAGRDEERQKAKSLSIAGGAVHRRDENEPTRTVAGRRFYQREGVWFDTAFKSGMSVTSVTRGSEQYRALIADEPEIATIAGQLRGEIYVVWKERCYHIR